ncbi:MAG: BON domain-containing protein [Pseudomonadota bacterium]|nr:BON domain-containing protein [Pseudomonadota bacterium]
MNIEHNSLVAAALAVVLLGGCAGSPTQASTGEYLDDTTLTTKVKTALLQDPQVSGLAINVETFKGEVQLSGFASSEEERQRAAAVANSVDGVAAVKNDIRLK